jgi:hypothetical protein
MTMAADIRLKPSAAEEAPFFADGAVVLTSIIHLMPQVSEPSPGIMLALRLDSGLARLTAEKLLGTPKVSVDQDVLDAVGEMSNILGGNLKVLLPVPHKLSLPVVISGSNYSQVLTNALGLRARAIQGCAAGRIVVELWEGRLAYAGR